MNHRIPSLTTGFTIKSRTGVTLIEVMVSMVIMSIGIVLLATLLPISILRTAQATQMTHAVFLKNNVSALLDANPAFLGKDYISTKPPLPNINNGITVAIIDPLGLQLGLQAKFGLLVARPRFSGFPTTVTPTPSLAEVEALAQLPDSWSLVMEGTVDSLSASSVRWAGSARFSGLNVRNSKTTNVNNAPHRMVLYDITGKAAVLKPLLYVDEAGQKLSWWDVDNAGAPLTSGSSMPTGFVPARVRVEAMQRRFTWLMTVKKQPTPLFTDDTSWSAETDVAIFFNRSFSNVDETPFDISVVPLGFDGKPGVAGVDDDNLNGPDDANEIGWPGSDDNRTVTVTIPTNVGAIKPYLKKGGFMFESSQLIWYRILNLSSSSTQATLLLDRDFVPSKTISQGIFMKGVVEVYPLGIQTGTQ